jgi:hypothetical protein
MLFHKIRENLLFILISLTSLVEHMSDILLKECVLGYLNHFHDLLTWILATFACLRWIKANPSSQQTISGKSPKHIINFTSMF